MAALNSVIELMRDLGRPRGDLWEVAVWEDAALGVTNAFLPATTRPIPDLAGAEGAHD